MRADPAFHDLVEAYKGAATDEQDVARVNLHAISFATLLACVVHRHMHRGALEDLEQRLLHAFSGDVARHGGVVHIAVGRLNEPTQHRFHVVAHIASLGERRGVDDDKRHLHGLCQRLRQKRLARPGRAYHNNIALLKFYAVVILRRHYPFIMIINGYGQDLLCIFLSDHIIVQKLFDFHRLQEIDVQLLFHRIFFILFFYNIRAYFHAFVTNINACRTRNQFLYLLLPFIAKRASDIIRILPRHVFSLLLHSTYFSKLA